MADLQLYKVDLTTPVPVEPGQPQRYGDDPKTSFTKHNDAMDAIEAALNDSETGSGEIDTRLTTAEGEIDTLQTDMTAAQTSIAGLGSALTTAEGEIDDLQASIATALQTDDIGDSVQAYDADTAKTDVEQTFSAKQTFTGIKDTVFDLTSDALSNSNGAMAKKTIAADTTITDSLTEGDGMVIEIAGGDSYVVTWPTIVWLGGVPLLTAKDVIVFFKLNSTLYGAYIGEA